eukprot:scaffold19.g1740.t1
MQPVLVALQLLLAAVSVSSTTPTVHLRTRARQLGLADVLFNKHEGRRALLQDAHHTHSAEWGLLRGAHQFLLTHAPHLSHAQRHELTQHIEGSGCRVLGYVPDHSLLVVGSREAAAAAAAHAHVLGVGAHEPADKLAPDWAGILAALAEALASSGNSSAAPAQQQEQRRQQQQRLDSALASLPVQVQRDAFGAPLVAVEVVFPALVVPQEHAEHGEQEHWQLHEQQQQRMQRAMREHAECDAGAAAAADWANPLRLQFGASIAHGARHLATVLVPPAHLGDVLDWLSQRPAVHWVAPAPRLRLRNKQAAAISQSGKPLAASSASSADPTLHPVWAAGITGANQTIGVGDSGVDRLHCYFYDPKVDWASGVRLQDGIRTFDSTSHYKIRYYRALGDTSDSNGHGTHVCGTLAGRPFDASVSSDTTDYLGMAPDAKLAFIDLADSSSDTIFTPADLQGEYFYYTTAVGALIHSDSWGSDTVYYDSLAAQVDMYSWNNKDFLPVFAAGNDGQGYTLSGASRDGATTVTSPANSKNCLSVGATQTSGESMTTGFVQYTVFDATATVGDNYATTFRVMQAAFGAGIGTLGTRSYPLVVASPLDACSTLQNAADAKGRIVLVQRGSCYFGSKAANAQAAGAVAALVFDDQLGSYFVVAADPATGPQITIPTMSITRRLGQNLQTSIAVGRNITLSFSPVTKPSVSSSFQNLSPYSSQGPTPDGRVKPDIVAPGTVVSAKVGLTGTNTCGTTTMAGTSMATPVVAGSAALVRQYYLDGWYPSGQKNAANSLKPSAALVKATLLGGAGALEGFEADTGLPIDPAPSFRQGFGRVLLGQSLFLSGSPLSPARMQVLDRIKINSGETHSFCVRANGGPLTITLVWADYPASPSAAKSLVNDLDLTVRAAGFNGIPLLGNGGSVSSPTSHDRENNVEQVALDSVPAGQVSIEVKTQSIYTAGGAPAYALVVLGDFGGTLAAPGGGGGDAGQCTITLATIKSGPSGLTNSQDITFAFSTQSGNTNGVAFECKLGDGNGNLTLPGTQNWTTCTSPQSYKGLPDGSYQFAVRGTGETISSTQNFVKVTQPPSLAWRSQRPSSGSTSDATAHFEFQGQAALAGVGVNFTCQLSVSEAHPLQAAVWEGDVNTQQIVIGQPFECSSPLDFHWLLPGAWSVQVTATDAAGNTAPSLSYRWLVALDSAKQYARLLSGPYGLQRKVNMTFAFKVLRGSDGQEATGTATECMLQAGGQAAPTYSPCSSPLALPGNLTDGNYTFSARAVGSSDVSTAAISTFSIDSVPPTVNITEKPSAIITSSSATLQFVSSKEGSSFKCRLVSKTDPSSAVADYKPCSSPLNYANLADGQYDFAVHAIDLVGNQGSPVNTSFAVDTQPPVFTSLSVPAAVSQPSVNISFTVDDGPAGTGIKNVTCRFRPLSLASSAQNISSPQFEWALCTSPVAYTKLAEGRYGLTLRASDNAGLVNTTAEQDMFVMLTTPKVNVTAAPTMQAPVPSTVTFAFADATGVPAAARPNITTYQTMVRATDQQTFWAQRNASSGSSSIKLSSLGRRLMAAAAVGQHRWLAAGWLASGRRLLQVASSASVGATLSADAVGSWTNCSSPCTYTGLSSGFYSFSVDASLDSSTGLPTWAIIAIAAGGGTVVLILSALLTWWCCRLRKRRAEAAAAHAGGFISSATPASMVFAGSAGAWGCVAGGQPLPRPQRPHVQQQPSYRPPPVQQQPAYRPGPGGYPVLADGTCPPHVLQADAIEAQQVAFALAASKKEVRREDADLARAIEASLQEQRSCSSRPREDDGDAELRTALEASRREQQLRAEMQPWMGGGGGGSNSQWR